MEHYKVADTLLSKRNDSMSKGIKRPEEIYFGECPSEVLEYIWALEEMLGISDEGDGHPYIGLQYQVDGYSNGKKVKTIAVYDGSGYKSENDYIPKQYAKNIKPVHASKI
jgi:hypothetical protein